MLLLLAIAATALPEDLRLAEDPPGLTRAYVALGVGREAIELDGEQLPHWGSGAALLRRGSYPPLTAIFDQRAEAGRALASQLGTRFEGRVWVELDEDALWADLEVPLRSAGLAGFSRFVLESEGERVGPLELPQLPRPFVDARPVRVRAVQSLALYDGERVAVSFRPAGVGEDHLSLARAVRDYEVDCARLYGDDQELVEICAAGEPRPACVASLEELPDLAGVLVLIDEDKPLVQQLSAIERARASARPVALQAGDFDCPDELADARELRRAEAAWVGTLVRPR
jgi:hypothetical protein